MKPFNVRELVLRVRALAKRSREAQRAPKAAPLAQTYRWRGIEIETSRHRVTIDGVPVTLRPLEFKLLATLLPQPGTIFSRGST